MRREFILPEDDICFLDSLGLTWETHIESNSQWLIIFGVSLPKGFNVESANVAINVPPGYPVTQLDMAFFFPILNRVDNVAINATSHHQQINSTTWQRWSRHRPPNHPWIPGVDFIGTHFLYINNWLEKEVHGINT